MTDRTIIRTPDAPSAFGPFSQGIEMDGWVFTSGQLPIDPATGQLVTGDVQAQTRQVIANLKAILKQAGASLEDVVKATVFITDMRDFESVNRVYAEFFPKDPPARSCIEVPALAKGAQVEIEAIARRRGFAS
jgi:2-iminobutanoate/2-iminopropanoate deaminase